jgi:hypothetical protein
MPSFTLASLAVYLQVTPLLILNLSQEHVYKILVASALTLNKHEVHVLKQRIE